MRSPDPLVRVMLSTIVISLGLLVVVIGRSTVPTVEVPVAVEPEIAIPAPAVPEQDQEPALDPEPLEHAVPLQVRIGSISVDAPLVPVGLEEDLAMEIPERVADIGWYDPHGLGVRPGSAGTAVLAGHVDSRRQGRGALYHLRDLRVDEIIEIDLEDGTTQRWRITEIIQYPKDVLPFDDLFVWSGPPRLAVITCGGEFDRTARSYTDNLVAYAESLDVLPASPSAPDA